MIYADGIQTIEHREGIITITLQQQDVLGNPTKAITFALTTNAAHTLTNLLNDTLKLKETP